MDVDSSLGSAMVPSLLLQPLVENAIRHAIAVRTTPGSIRVTAHGHETRLLIGVCDDGSGQAAVTPGHGVGLASMRARLQCLYGDDFRFEMRTSPGAGTRVHIDLPLQPLTETA